MQHDLSEIKNYHIRKQKEKNYAREQIRLMTYSNVYTIMQRYLRENPQTIIYLFGSILRPGKFHESSDIDIALENVHESRLDLYARWTEEIKRDIDIVLLEKCDFAEYIYKYGERVDVMIC